MPKKRRVDEKGAHRKSCTNGRGCPCEIGCVPGTRTPKEKTNSKQKGRKRGKLERRRGGGLCGKPAFLGSWKKKRLSARNQALAVDWPGGAGGLISWKKMSLRPKRERFAGIGGTRGED